ncbi:MAG TPA: TldD/PmbA family protein [Thermotogota bacterium]|nr:TldD/PmbA family protein [Thermotogota bacterium]HNR62636.1 TldD/PmbA family protein [Thermotogota bacterium]HNT94642.1 TldD/PmbA family protein [Thermotogota bacterium]HOZ11019.1 TldD/PmbA family protein [Thermotogota bacterium]HPB85955.1 TldD/PmbA family protein [Thermotogota bacterium]
MNFETFKNAVFDIAAKKGLKNYELFGMEQREFEINFFEGAIEGYKDASSSGASFKTIVDGKAGMSFTEVWTPETAEKIIDDACENSQQVDASDPEFIYEGNGSYRTFPPFEDRYVKLPVEEKIAYGLEMEKAAKAHHPSIVNIPHCTYFDAAERFYVSNSHGVHLECGREGGGGYLVAVASDGKAAKTGLEFVAQESPVGLDFVTMAQKAAERALKKLGAKSIKSGKYPIILDYNMVGELLSLFSFMINAENVQKGLSLLAGKLHRAIVSPAITIVNEPYIEGGISNIPFDAEGVPTKTLTIVQNGILETFLHRIKTAKKDGVPPTGNATRGRYNQAPAIAPQNLLLRAGPLSLEELMRKMGDGLYITDLQGMHSGANPYSGQLSLAAEGFRIENGKIAYPVEQITIAGNVLELFGKVAGIGSESKLSLPSGNFSVYCPDLYFSEADIAGTESPS